MITSAIDASAIQPIDHREATGLAREEYRRFAAALATLDGDDWSASTPCDGWTVRDMAGHVVGAMRAAASMRENIGQQRAIKARMKRLGGSQVDQMTAHQIDITDGLDVAALIAECDSLVDAAAQGRRRTPAPMRRLMRVHVEMGPFAETWTLGYLVDVILTRDIWMHRQDIAEATGTAAVLDDVHDARIVEDIVGEWARRHRQPFDLELTGPAGGHYLNGTGGERIEIDASEFLIVLSGRDDRSGLLGNQVPF